MTRYAPIEGNSEVTDVLFCIVNGKNSVKIIMETLKQPQSTVSTKLRFLRKSKVVTKQRWRYDIDWKNLYKVFMRAMKEWIKVSIDPENKAEVNKLLDLFTEERVERIIKTYASSYMQTLEYMFCLKSNIIKGKDSIADVAYNYLKDLVESDDETLKKLDGRFVDLKKMVELKRTTKTLFLESEAVQ